MKHRKRVTKSGKTGKRGSAVGARRKSGKHKGITLRRASGSMEDVLKFYKPIKKPVTLRLDADVIAWFKRDGRRYQTRINAALRRVMGREMRQG